MKIYVLVILIVNLLLNISGMYFAVRNEKDEAKQWAYSIGYLIFILAVLLAIIFHSLQLH